MASRFEDNGKAGRLAALTKTTLGIPRVKKPAKPEVPGHCPVSISGILTELLQKSHRQHKTIGLVQVDISEVAHLAAQYGEADFHAPALAVIQHCVRPTDRVCCCAPHKYLAVLADVNVDMLVLLADQIRRRLIGELAARELKAKARVGNIVAVLYTPTEGKPFTPNRLLEELASADSAAARSGTSQTILRSIEHGRSIPVRSDVIESLVSYLAENQVPVEINRNLVANESE